MIFSVWLGFSLLIATKPTDSILINSMLCCYAGWTVAFVGFMMNNCLVLIAGALVAASGHVFTQKMSLVLKQCPFSLLWGTLKAKDQ
jgi:NAD(P) transhydrogenase subunit beta